MTNNEREIRTIIEDWAKAVRAKDVEGILKRHADDIVMFDVPPPFKSSGIEAYRQTWDLFFGCAKDSVVFDIEDLVVVAGDDVAFCYASMRCLDYTKSGEPEPLQFRLTTGLTKVQGEWVIQHEHHSVPSE